MAKHSADLLALARKGAEYRYEELQAEISALVKHFPHLSARSVRFKPGKELAKAAPTARKRPRMTAAQKKAVSVRMRKYWAQRRAEKAEKKR